MFADNELNMYNVLFSRIQLGNSYVFKLTSVMSKYDRPETGVTIPKYSARFIRMTLTEPNTQTRPFSLLAGNARLGNCHFVA